VPQETIILDREPLDEMITVTGRGATACAFADRLLDLFEQTSRSDQSALAAAIEINDLERVAFVAHRLTGGAANVGAVALSEVAMELRDAARAGDRSGCNALLTDVATCVESTIGELAKWRATLAGEAT